MSLPIVGQENAAQVRMIIKNHSEQVVSFSFVPIGCAPDAGNTRHVRIILTQHYFQTHSVMLRS